MKSRFLTRYYGNNRAAKVIYGTILIFVVLIGLSHSTVTSSITLAITTFVAALSIVFAEVYAEIIGFTVRNKGPLTKEERTEVYEDSFAIASVSFWPSLILLVSGTGLYSTSTALSIGYVFCIIILVSFSYWAARLSNFSIYKSFVIAVITAIIGLCIITLKYQFGH